MISLQQWLDREYPLEGRNRITELDISDKNLEGSLNLIDFISLEKLKCYSNRIVDLNVSGLSKLAYLDCHNNQLRSLTVNNCRELTSINCNYNQLTDFDFASLNPKKITSFRMRDNKISTRNLSCFSSLINLEWLYIGKEDGQFGDSNHFFGSLKYLRKLTKLKGLFISGTDIESGLEYLPNSLEYFWCDSYGTSAKVVGIEESLAIYGGNNVDSIKKWKIANPDLVQKAGEYLEEEEANSLVQQLKVKKFEIEKEKRVNDRDNKDKIQELKLALSEEQKVLSQRQDELSNKKDEMNKLNSELAKVKLAEANSYKKLQNLKVKLVSKLDIGNFDSWEEEIEKLKSNSGKTDLDYIQKELIAKQKEVDRLKNEKEEIVNRYKGYINPANLEEKAKKRGMVTKLEYEKISKNQRPADLPDNWKTELERMKDLREQLSGKERELTRIQKNSEASERQKTELSVQIEDLRDELVKLSQEKGDELVAMNRKNNQLASDLMNERDRVNSLQLQLDNLKSFQSSLPVIVNYLNSTKAIMERNIEDYEDIMSTEERKKTKEEYKQWKEKLEEEQKELVAQIEQINSFIK